jgi:hypothetical protein
MEDKGSLIFYIILAIIAIAGSLQGRKKKAPAGKPKPAGMTMTYKPEQTKTSTVRTVEKGSMPRYETPAPSQEGNYESPLAGEFASEGSFSRTIADDFASEGSIEDTMAAAFASEGISSLSEAPINSSADNAIAEGEIHDIPEYNYSESAEDDLTGEGFNLRRAVIYSAILNRKEYSF